ncbi:hypothetical protein FHW83_002904 [Duganella sp. SG902]|uniref:hypothetical protein n=1 Tax=Duganella sp. SG902 TaxID=2587016 RepID=UPI00159E7CB7|nr:hypothetical protein [Duganella sp. SG902]NVM77098.1 hypothetical protein [Duganella sp. SG902]
MSTLHLSTLFALLAFGGAQAATVGAENCRVILPAKVELAGETVEWKGPCANGYAEGDGVLLRFVKQRQVASFEGRMAQGMMAEGYEKTADGAQYEGQYKNGLREGKGSAIEKDGTRYDGEWRAGLREGRGVANFPLGGSYDGPWRDGQPGEGDGKITYAGGMRTIHARDFVPPPQDEGEVQRFRVKGNTLNSLQRFPEDLAYGTAVPFDKGYAEMTPQQQQHFRRQYPFLHADDIPPYPEKGTAEIMRWLSKAQSNALAQGEFRAIVDVDAAGKATAITTYASPSAQLTDVVKILLFNQKFTPARCDGKPCAMRFPFTVQFKN